MLCTGVNEICEPELDTLMAGYAPANENPEGGVKAKLEPGAVSLNEVPSHSNANGNAISEVSDLRSVQVPAV